MINCLKRFLKALMKLSRLSFAMLIIHILNCINTIQSLKFTYECYGKCMHRHRAQTVGQLNENHNADDAIGALCKSG